VDWILVDEMNPCFGPLHVETLWGRGLERSARVADEGAAVLEAKV